MIQTRHIVLLQYLGELLSSGAAIFEGRTFPSSPTKKTLSFKSEIDLITSVKSNYSGDWRV
jgi:hypothetical protein